MTKRFSKYENYLVGRVAIEKSSSYAKDLFHCSQDRVTYHKTKVASGGKFHSKPHGGSSYFPTSPFAKGSEAYRKICAALWWKCRSQPTTKVREYKYFIAQKLGISISETSIRRIFTSWGWSWKKPVYIQYAKFSAQNIEYYFNFVIWVLQQDPMKCKYLDECHFSSKKLVRQLGLSQRGEPVICVHNIRLDLGSRTMTLLTSLSNPNPVFVELKQGTNNQFDFLKFVLNAVAAGYLEDGDILLLDNAKIHHSATTVLVLADFLRSLGISMFYLPTYSPELNPCELCFSFIKNAFRTLRSGNNLEFEIALAVESVVYSDVVSFYNKCRNVLK